MLIRLLNRPSTRIYAGNLLIRGSSIGLRFFLTVFIGKVYPESFLGEYGLFSTSIILSYFILSVSFDAYAHREILNATSQERARLIRDLFLFYLISYVVLILPLSLGLIYYDFLNTKLLVLFLAILLFEVVSQSLFGLLIILQKSLKSNIVLFLSQGFWILIIFLLWATNHSFISRVEDVLLCWMLGEIVAVLVGFYYLSRLFEFRIFGSVDWKWIKRGVSVSVMFFGSSISYKVIEFADRYFIEWNWGMTNVGIYVFYAQLANLISAVINATVIIVMYPMLISSILKHDLITFNAIKNKMYFRIIILGVLVALFEVIIIEFVLQFLGKESFKDEIATFYILLVSNAVMNISFVPHYCLYATRKDKAIIITTIAGTILCLILNWMLVPVLGIIGAAMATCSGFVFIFILKAVYFELAVRPNIFSVKESRKGASLKLGGR